MPAALPAGWRLAPDPDLHRRDEGRVLLGGNPFRAWRLDDRGAAVANLLLGGEPIGTDGARRGLARRLLDAGMAHPVPDGSSRSATDVAVVVPFLGPADELAATLAALGPTGPVVVVDDASPDAAGVAAVAGRFGAGVVRHPINRGPAAARNTGWRSVASGTEVVAFVDGGCRPESGWLAQLLAHLDDPSVAAVAPRIVAPAPALDPSTSALDPSTSALDPSTSALDPSTSALDPALDSAPSASCSSDPAPVASSSSSSLPPALAAYERARPSLDRGGRPGAVRPRGRVPFVPSATLVVRRADLERAGGFDEALRYGEDVDLVWRLVGEGRTVRYEPGVVVAHVPRPSTRSWLRQRYDYGTSAAPLARRHDAAVRPLGIAARVAAAWALAAGVGSVPGLACAAATTVALARKLPAVPGRRAEAVRLSVQGHGYAGLALVEALRRPWWPVLAAAAVPFRRARRLAALVVVVPPLVEWARQRPPLDPVRWTTLRLADDLAYGTGVWAGCARERSLRALHPVLLHERRRRLGRSAGSVDRSPGPPARSPGAG